MGPDVLEDVEVELDELVLVELVLEEVLELDEDELVVVGAPAVVVVVVVTVGEELTSDTE